MPKSQLEELYAHGLGVIEDARLDFGPGFNVLTGETGAGKTLLLGALDLCLGGDGSMTRYAAAPDLRTAAIFSRDDGTDVVLSREASPSGRLRCSFNGVPSSAEALRNFAGELIVIHGQHDSLSLRTRAEIVRIVDASAGISTSELDQARRESVAARRLREDLGGDRPRRARELDFVTFQIAELETAALGSASELDDALVALTRSSEVRDGQMALAQVLERLDGDRDDAILASLAHQIGQLPRGGAYESARAILRNALETAREGIHELNDLHDADAFDADEIARLEERIGALQSIARKYGGSLDAAMQSLERLRDERRAVEATTERLHQLDVEIEDLDRRSSLLANEALRERRLAATRLSEAVQRHLPRVALAHAALRFVVEGEDGSDAQILFTPNPGQPEGPLQTLASGGELSRVLLALSLEMAHEDVVAVFDEVDAGIGGQVAQQIGECLRELGDRQQVLAVTHLASVAAKADRHLVVEKSQSPSGSSTTVRVVSGEQRVAEIARMLAGSELTIESLALAHQLLEASKR